MAYSRIGIFTLLFFKKKTINLLYLDIQYMGKYLFLRLISQTVREIILKCDQSRRERELSGDRQLKNRLIMSPVLSASVLDRLNALLEPGGSLTINERGVIDGKTPKITPHPNFR